MKYAIDLLQRDLNIELRSLAAATEFTKGNGFSMSKATQEAFDESKRLAEQRIPQLEKAIKILKMPQKYDCQNCQGNGCVTCHGFGYLTY
jgi:hypothetical protein